MKLFSYLRLLVRLPKTLDDLERRLACLENPMSIATIQHNDQTQTIPDIQVTYIQDRCPGGCVFPSHSIGPGSYACINCGRRLN